MRVLIVGYGVQGQKRKKILNQQDVFGSFDNKNSKATFRDINKIPHEKYDSVFLCVPDDQKTKLIKFFFNLKKNILVEKPLILKKISDYKNLQILSRKKGVYIYSAYNHRFEPHFEKVKEILDKKILGKVYLCKIFYGNGTSRLVKKNKWRDKGHGVVQDIGPHLFDIINYWFKLKGRFKYLLKSKFENKSPDHSLLAMSKKNKKFILEMTYCMWRNTFNLDIIGSKGSLRVNRLCKWGPSEFFLRKRILPSGKPIEYKKTIIMKDPTWAKEHKFFFNKEIKKAKTDLSNDLYIFKTLKNLNLK